MTKTTTAPQPGQPVQPMKSATVSITVTDEEVNAINKGISQLVAQWGAKTANEQHPEPIEVRELLELTEMTLSVTRCFATGHNNDAVFWLRQLKERADFLMMVVKAKAIEAGNWPAEKKA